MSIIINATNAGNKTLKLNLLSCSSLYLGAPPRIITRTTSNAKINMIIQKAPFVAATAASKLLSVLVKITIAIKMNSTNSLKTAAINTYAKILQVSSAAASI
jgi:hypothetical protein